MRTLTFKWGWSEKHYHYECPVCGGAAHTGGVELKMFDSASGDNIAGYLCTSCLNSFPSTFRARMRAQAKYLRKLARFWRRVSYGKIKVLGSRAEAEAALRKELV